MADSTPFILAMARHLPPSSANLQLIDINGAAGSILAEQRADISIRAFTGSAVGWADVSSHSIDAVVGYAYIINDAFLTHVFRALRPGGRLIIVDPRGSVQKMHGQRLEEAGFVRILVEAALQLPQPTGVLIRSEKPHHVTDTPSRIAEAARQDADHQDLSSFRGRYVHLLVQQTPNRPVWRMEPGELIQWRAVALDGPKGLVLLAFSSLPKAVAFMQPAVMAGVVRDVNKVGKFSLETAQNWLWPVLLNPTLDAIVDRRVTYIAVDPTTAEAPDE